MIVRAASPFASLAFHGLAHLPLSGIASLFAPEYVAFCAAAMPLDAREPLASDAAAIAAQIEAASAALALQWLPRLHDDLASFTRSAATDLGDLPIASAADPRALTTLRAVSPVGIEWLRADLALAAPSFERWRAGVDGELAEACARVDRALLLAPPAFRPAVVELAWSLGARGRAFERAVVVGAPVAWCGADALRSAVVAIHETAVRAARGTYAEREWSALRSVARALASTSLAEAHAGWLASLDLSVVLASTPLAPAIIETMMAEPGRRAEVLAGLHP